MGTTSEKLTYLNDTKLVLKDMINYGLDTGEKITSETTFRNYVRSLFDAFIKTMTYPDVLYDNLPKVTGTGTNVTLNGTVEAPMRNELSPSAISQDGEPSPSNPQDIHTVSGENTVKIQNKNLFDKDNMQNGFIPSSGDYPTSNPSYPNAKYYLVPLNANDSITISGSTNTYGRVRCINRETNKVIGSVTYATNDYYTTDKDYSSGFSSGTIIAKKDIILAFMVIQGTDTLDTFQIEYGTTATSYEPHKEQTYPLSLADLEYCKIGDYEDLFFKNVINSEYYDSTLELDKWYLKKNTIKRFLKDFTFTRSVLSSGNILFRVNLNYYGDAGSVNVLSSHFLGITDNQGNILNSIRENVGHNCYIVMEDNEISETATTFKNWCNTNNVYAYFKLLTPTYTLLNETLQTQLDNLSNAISYQEQTNVSQENNDLPFVIKMSAIRDLSGIFEEI